jgi:hypothetical protein
MRNERVQGKIKGVSSLGKLVLLVEEEEREFDLKEIRFIPRNEL